MTYPTLRNVLLRRKHILLDVCEDIRKEQLLLTGIPSSQLLMQSLDISPLSAFATAFIQTRNS